MSTGIYYFSGTGNSLAVARSIAINLNAALRPIAACRGGGSIAGDVDAIGIVFPTYMAQLNGVPLLVARFIGRIENIGSKHIFAVCTCGGHEDFNGLPTLRNLAKMVRSMGGRVAAEYSIRLPMNTLDYSHIPVPIDKDPARMFQKAEQTISEICLAAVKKKASRYKAVKTVLNCIMTPVYLMLHSVYYKDLRAKAREPETSTLRYFELVPLTDRSIYADERCQGCGTCSKVCPVGNITIDDGKPSWHHHCELCLACAEWCPSTAIHHGYRTEGKTYRHPGVTLEDMFVQAGRQYNQSAR